MGGRQGWLKETRGMRERGMVLVGVGDVDERVGVVVGGGVGSRGVGGDVRGEQL